MSETSGAVDGAASTSPARTEDVRERPQAPRSKAMRARLVLLLGLAPLARAGTGKAGSGGGSAGLQGIARARPVDSVLRKWLEYLKLLEYRRHTLQK